MTKQILTPAVDRDHLRVMWLTAPGHVVEDALRGILLRIAARCLNPLGVVGHTVALVERRLAGEDADSGIWALAEQRAKEAEASALTERGAQADRARVAQFAWPDRAEENEWKRDDALRAERHADLSIYAARAVAAISAYFGRGGDTVYAEQAAEFAVWTAPDRREEERADQLADLVSRV